ncbi:MAG TPA: glycoside hydrolase family 9 protein [Verrucomicrobiae bacterium]|nr:glycoside hydrolase family 9 protein [Verrucomicrobiae bacterium]
MQKLRPAAQPADWNFFEAGPEVLKSGPALLGLRFTFWNRCRINAAFRLLGRVNAAFRFVGRMKAAFRLGRRCFKISKCELRLLGYGLLILLGVPAWGQALTLDSDVLSPQVGDHALRVLSPNLLELYLVNTKQPDPARVDTWDWVDDAQLFHAPALTQLKVLVAGRPAGIAGIGFKRRPRYAPLLSWDLRIANHLYLQLSDSIPEGATVQVSNNGTLWPTNLAFSATADALRFNPALHVNQEGYLPSYAKTAAVGYYLGDLGEMAIPTNKFRIVSVPTGATVFEGTLTLRKDTGYNYTPTPYQNVYEADFTALSTPGLYYLVVPGLGASLPFRIDEGIAMAFARTYALGMFEQRSGFRVWLPYTRFTHGTDHFARALIPTNDSTPFVFTWQTVSNYESEVNSDNPPQSAPGLTNSLAQLYPFVNQGTVSVTGGHFEAGDYNRVTYNGAQLVHTLIFAVDSLGVGTLDNLGLPESGDGISDALQEAKWEADFIAKMQDADGAFYYSVYPQNREYEMDVLPENGDPQVVWPKNTASTAAAVAALAQCASSSRFKQAYPQVAAGYLAKAILGWKFLTNAIQHFGLEGSYQKIQHFDDDFTHHDELAWAAGELYLATGEAQYQQKLFEWFPNPADQATFRWGWQRMGVCYGNIIREYAFAVSSGRLAAAQVQPDYLAQCINVITNRAEDVLGWSKDNAYGTSFPDLTKAYRDGGWYFSSEQAFDLAVAYQLSPNPAYLDAVLRNMNFEGGCNPVNVTYVTGLGWKRPRNVVDQYSLNDRRVLPKDGVPQSNITPSFQPVWTYGWELSGLVYPGDYIDTAPYPYYDRWCDDWNVSTEGSTTDTARSFAATAWLAARTALASQPWRSQNATIAGPIGATAPGVPVTLNLNVTDTNLASARIVWEASGQEPVFGGPTYTFTPESGPGAYWVEAEAQWPDGRRVFATNNIVVTSEPSAQLTDFQVLNGGGISFSLVGKPSSTYFIQVSTDLQTWATLTTNALPTLGVSTISDPRPVSGSARFYRAVQSQ